MNRKWILACSLMLFIAACCLPALEFRRNEDGQEIWSGGQCLAIGWLGLLLGYFAWLANAWLLLGVVYLLKWRRRDCIVSMVLALLFSLHSLALFHGPIPGDEANVNKLFFRRFREGSYCWIASMGVVLAGACLVRLKPQTEPVSHAASNGDELPPDGRT